MDQKYIFYREDAVGASHALPLAGNLIGAFVPCFSLDNTMLTYLCARILKQNGLSAYVRRISSGR